MSCNKSIGEIKGKVNKLKGNKDNPYIINLREVVSVNKLKIISKVRINGELVSQEDIEPEVFRMLVEEKITTVMEQIGFERIKTA